MGEETTTTAEPSRADTPKTFTQDELDRVIAERLRREREKFSDYDALREKASKFDELDAAQKTELERAVTRAEAAEKARDEALGRAKQTARASALIAAAVKAGAVDPDAVVALVAADAVEVGDDGNAKGADDAVKALLDAKPYLRTPTSEPTDSQESGTSTPSKPNGSADGGTRETRPGQLTREHLKTMKPDEIVAAKEAGQLNDLLGIT